MESIIVVSFFTLCFLGALYFKELYVGKLHVQRLARASALSFAMSACKGDPKAGLEHDLPSNTPPPGQPGSAPLPASDLHSNDQNAQGVLDGLDNTKGGAPFDETTQITVQTNASATTQKDAASPKQGFQSTVASDSTLTCIDPVSDDSFTDIIPRVEATLDHLL